MRIFKQSLMLEVVAEARCKNMMMNESNEVLARVYRLSLIQQFMIRTVYMSNNGSGSKDKKLKTEGTTFKLIDFVSNH